MADRDQIRWLDLGVALHRDQYLHAVWAARSRWEIDWHRRSVDRILDQRLRAAA